MKTLKTIILLILPFIINAQSFPSDTKVLEDVKKYHGKIATATVQNDWKLEKEAGYTFSNMAKRVVAATTVKEKGVSKKIIGLAIYVRGGAGEKWNFSRYFVTTSEATGLAPLTEQQIKDQTLDLLRTNPSRVFVNYKDIAWVYDITFPEGLKSETDRTGDVIYQAAIEYEQKFISSYPFEGGLRRYKPSLEIYVRLEDGAMKVAVAVVGYAEPIGEKLMTEKQHDALIVLGQKPFDELFGPAGPTMPGVEKASSDKKSNTKSTGLKVPKLKIKGF